MKTCRLALAGLLALLTGLGCKPREQAKAPAEPAAETRSGPAAWSVPPAREVQEPQVAGAFYPADPDQLRLLVSSLLERAEPPALSGRIFGLICPHAGYIYSGQVAAFAYKALARSPGQRFVILGPSHRAPLAGVFVLVADAYRTPLGEVKLDRARAERLAGMREWIVSDHRYYRGEHSLEVQLPFLQVVAGNDLEATIVMLGELSRERCADLARLLRQVFPEPDTVFIASTDMSHGNYPPYQGSDQVRPVDFHTLELIKALDLPALDRGVRDHTTPLCGGMAVLTLLELFQLESGGTVEVLKYSDSGDATGDHSQVVGYASVALLLPRKESGP
jgi:AmmeMemoRadiSam system protein B